MGGSATEKTEGYPAETMRLAPFAVVMLLVSQDAIASKNFISVTDPVEIDKILRKIPARNANLSFFLRRYGLTVESILLSDPDESDISDGSSSSRRGDRFLDINLREPLPAGLECPLFQPISFTLRRGKYLPGTTTANFLSHSKCEPPGK